MIDWKPEDSRKPRGGWAPGGYICKCRTCQERYIGDKRSYTCADCAYNDINLKDLFND